MSADPVSLEQILDLEKIEVWTYRGFSWRPESTRVFGGQVAGQALAAAGRTVPDGRRVHSLHAYFLRPGDTGAPLLYTVEPVRDGRSFSTRRVLASQARRGGLQPLGVLPGARGRHRAPAEQLGGGGTGAVRGAAFRRLGRAGRLGDAGRADPFGQAGQLSPGGGKPERRRIAWRKKAARSAVNLDFND